MTIEATRIILAALWIILMLTYLLGDVLRIYSGDFNLDEFKAMIGSHPQAMMMFIAVLMLIPIVMILLSLVVAHPAIRWINIIAAIGMFLFNLVGLPTYKSTYDKFLIVVGLVWNAITVWYAWNWVEAASV